LLLTLIGNPHRARVDLLDTTISAGERGHVRVVVRPVRRA
jgi:hypothetical protein